MSSHIEELLQLYNNKSKHSNYQILPSILKNYITEDGLQVSTRYESERLRYINRCLDVSGKTIIDIGGNTGYFSLELIEAGASHVDYVEGNAEHAHFVKLATKITGLEKRISVKNDYFDFNNIDGYKYDIAVVLNVLHHVGDDYGDSKLDVKEAKKTIIKDLNAMSTVVEYMIFQLGFNSQGDIRRPLFKSGTKRELIDFITDGSVGYWQIVYIGIAEGAKDNVKYQNLNDINIERNDSLGEFLNRPLFILKSLNYAKK